jgi:diguanylate cyclase (GGDEF)-like protein
MSASLQRTKWRLTPTAVISSLVIAMAMVATFLLLLQRQEAIERAADRIYDVAMPTMSEATRIVRGLERLAHAGESLMWIEDISYRKQVRIALVSIAEDGSLQGTPEMRATITDAFVALDKNLAQLAKEGYRARAECLTRWRPHAQKLFDLSEAVGTSASMSAIEDADRIIEATRDSRDRVWRLAAALVFVALIALTLFFFLVVRPLIRLAKTLELAQKGYDLALQEETFREFQMVSDAAQALAEGHRMLVANKRELELLAHTDVLSGLPNRRQFILSANNELMRHDRYGYVASLIMFDLDHFKQINDRFGHEGGDAVLKVIGTGLSGLIRRVDILARIGGEEFAVLLPEQGQDVAMLTAERLRAAVEGMHVKTAEHGTCRFTASFGIAQHIKGESLETLMNRADGALYQAKDEGRNRVVVAPPPTGIENRKPPD